MLDLKKILGSQVQKKGIAKSMEASVVCDKFDEWARKKFGQELGKQIKAVHFKQGTLTISTSSSTLSQEIKLKEQDIKSEVNGILGQSVITHLAFRG
jgi:hypothetical protein